MNSKNDFYNLIEKEGYILQAVEKLHSSIEEINVILNKVSDKTRPEYVVLLKRKNSLLSESGQLLSMLAGDFLPVN